MVYQTNNKINHKRLALLVSGALSLSLICGPVPMQTAWAADSNAVATTQALDLSPTAVAVAPAGDGTYLLTYGTVENSIQRDIPQDQLLAVVNTLYSKGATSVTLDKSTLDALGNPAITIPQGKGLQVLKDATTDNYVADSFTAYAPDNTSATVKVSYNSISSTTSSPVELKSLTLGSNDSGTTVTAENIKTEYLNLQGSNTTQLKNVTSTNLWVPLDTTANLSGVRADTVTLKAKSPWATNRKDAALTGTDTKDADGNVTTPALKANTIKLGSASQLSGLTIAPATAGGTVTIINTEGNFTDDDKAALEKVVANGTALTLKSLNGTTTSTTGTGATVKEASTTPTQPTEPTNPSTPTQPGTTKAQDAYDAVAKTYQALNPFAQALPSKEEITTQAERIAQTAVDNSETLFGQSTKPDIQAAVQQRLSAYANQAARSAAAPSLASNRTALILSDVFTDNTLARTSALRDGIPASSVSNARGEDAVWVAIKGGQADVDDSDVYGKTKVKATTYQFGFDVPTTPKDYLGFFVGTATGSADYKGSVNGSIDIKNALQGGFYGTHLLPRGHYLDYIVQAGTFDSKTNGQSWSTNTVGTALTYGTKYQTASNLTVNPYLRFKYDRVLTDDVTYTSGSRIHVDDQNVFSAKAGVNLLNAKGLYGGLAYSRGLSGSYDAAVNGITLPSSDFDTNVIYLSLGYRGNVSTNTVLDLNVEKLCLDYNGWHAAGHIEFRF